MADKTHESTAATTKSGGNGSRVPAAGGMYPPLASIRDELDKMFSRYMTGWPATGFGLGRWGRDLGELFPGIGHSPTADLTETDKDFELSVELPGMDESDIELTVTDDTVTLAGEKRESQESKDKDFHLTERRYGSFRRTFPVPPGVDAEKVKAAFAKGVLTVTMPKSKQARARRRKVEVKTA